MNNLREQFLERFIRALFQKKGEGFVLKGGGAMRALFDSERLTKDVDLDFTNPKRSADSLHHSIRHAIDSAARGLALRDLTVSEPGKRESSPKWKINFLDADGQRCHVEVEVSRDPQRAPPGAVVQKPFVPRAAGIPRFWVDIYDEPTLIATKLAALLGREAARDVYDLDLLMGASARPPSRELLQWAVQRAHLDAADPLTTLRAHLEALTWERYLMELRDALPEETVARIDELEWQAMKKRVGDYLANLLQRS